MIGEALKQIAAEITAATGLKTAVNHADVALPCLLLGVENQINVSTLDGSRYELEMSIYLVTAPQKTTVVMDELGNMLKAVKAWHAAPARWDIMAITLEASSEPCPALKSTTQIIVTE